MTWEDSLTRIINDVVRAAVSDTGRRMATEGVCLE